MSPSSSRSLTGRKAEPHRCPIDPRSLEPVLAPLGEAVTLPREVYEDPSVLVFERRHIFEHDWVCVGREQEVERPGDHLLARLTAPGVIVVRGHDLELRAFHNVCRHRAAQIVCADRGHDRSFVCPYHGFVYRLDGRLIEAPSFEGDSRFDMAAQGLVPCDVRVVEGLVFVRAGSGGDGQLDGLAERLAGLGLRRLHRARRKAHDVAANWKIVVENFVEAHHFELVHPELEALTQAREAATMPCEGAWVGGSMALVEGAETVSVGGSARGRPMLSARRGEVLDFFVWPQLFLSVQPDYLLTYRLEPLSIASTRVVAEIWFHPAVASGEHPTDDVLSFWDVVNEQDREICERVQRGVCSPAYEQARYAPNEDGVHRFDGWVARRYLGLLPAFGPRGA